MYVCMNIAHMHTYGRCVFLQLTAFTTASMYAYVWYVWLYVHKCVCFQPPPHTRYSALCRVWQKADCHDFRCIFLPTTALCADAMCQSVIPVRSVWVCLWYMYVCKIVAFLSLLITLHSTVWILGRMRAGSVGVLQRSIRKLLIIAVITAAHWAAIRQRWVANKYAPNIHICSCCFFDLIDLIYIVFI